MAVNLSVDLAAGRFDDDLVAHAVQRAASLGYRLLDRADVDERTAAWIDWQFAPSWWSSEVRAGRLWIALGPGGEPAGFAAYGARGLRYPWLRACANEPGVGIFGPFGVAAAHRKTGLGAALLDAALASLRRLGYARALIPAVGFERLQAMYVERVGARVVDTYAYDPPRRYRAVILASGGGTNAQNVFDAVAQGRLALEVAQVVTNDASAGVIARARRAGVPVRAIGWDRPREPRSAFDARVLAATADAQPELVLLLGWMHLLPPAFVDRFPALLNVHPAYLPFDPEADDVTFPDGSVFPVFRGAHAIRDALRAAVPWIGASVHRVTAATDRGAILVRTPLPIDPRGDAQAIADRLRPLEHAAVTAAIRRWIFERNGEA